MLVSTEKRKGYRIRVLSQESLGLDVVYTCNRSYSPCRRPWKHGPDHALFITDGSEPVCGLH